VAFAAVDIKLSRKDPGSVSACVLFDACIAKIPSVLNFYFTAHVGRGAIVSTKPQFYFTRFFVS
jgi:hypothetical protein